MLDRLWNLCVYVCMYVCMLVVGLELGDYVDVEVTTLEGKG